MIFHQPIEIALATGLIKNLGEDTDRRTGGAPGSQATGYPLGTPAEAAEESCRIVGTPGFYPGRLVDADYIARFTPVMKARQAAAGSRLAVLLNQMLK